jgi:acetyl-CoA carboxylase carboxyl transferase subunit alpha
VQELKRFAYDFEQKLLNLELEIARLKEKKDLGEAEIFKLKELECEYEKLFIETYSKLTPWQKVLLARHPYRPTATFYIKELFKDFREIKGDRRLPDDPAVICGFGSFEGMEVAVAAIEKGADTKEKQKRRFGMPLPEGYYKFIRLIRLAEKLDRPIVTLVDTPGAYPGLEAEERGQALAIASSIKEMIYARVPTISVIIGEGGSGGALAMASADRVFVFENAYYSVISPEGCASILFHSEKEAPKAAEILRLTADDLLSLGLIHGVIKEPLGSAYRNPEEAAENLRMTIHSSLRELVEIPKDELLKRRIEFYLKIKPSSS